MRKEMQAGEGEEEEEVEGGGDGEEEGEGTGDEHKSFPIATTPPPTRLPPSGMPSWLLSC